VHNVLVTETMFLQVLVPTDTSL